MPAVTLTRIGVATCAAVPDLDDDGPVLWQALTAAGATWLFALPSRLAYRVP